MKKILLPVAALALFAAAAIAQNVLTVKDFHHSSKSYVGNSVSISGLAYNIRQETKVRNGLSVAFTTLNLYETDAKGRKGRYYVFVSIPSDSFKEALNEGQPTTITGPIQWPYMIGRIDDQP